VKLAELGYFMREEDAATQQNMEKARNKAHGPGIRFVMGEYGQEGRLLIGWLGKNG
jgi:hypothetical protein